MLHSKLTGYLVCVRRKLSIKNFFFFLELTYLIYDVENNDGIRINAVGFRFAIILSKGALSWL